MSWLAQSFGFKLEASADSPQILSAAPAIGGEVLDMLIGDDPTPDTRHSTFP